MQKSKWKKIKINRKHLGMMTENGYYISLQGKNYVGLYIISPLKLVHINESDDFFELVTKDDFDYKTVFLKRNSKSSIESEEIKHITGLDVINIFKGKEVKDNA